VVNAAPKQERSENAGSARAAGIEMDVRYAPAAELAWFANLTQTRTRVEMPTDPDRDGTEIPLAPETVFNAGLTVTLPGRVTLSPYYHWVGRYYDGVSRSSRLAYGNYGFLNVRLKQQLRPGIDVVIDLNNIGNRRYDMPWDFRDPGFNAFARLNFTF
jgi:iron complex outermembrane recepter protein